MVTNPASANEFAGECDDVRDVWKPSKEEWPKLKHLEGADLTSSELLVFAALCDFANPYIEHWPSWVPRMRGFASWLGVSRISRLTGQSNRAVQYALQRLEARNAVKCIYKSKGGAPGSRNGKDEPAKTNCYLLTPHSVHRSAPETLQPMHRSEPAEPCKKEGRTLHQNTENGAPRAPYNPAPGAPELLTLHHHQKERLKEDLQNPLHASSPDDDDERTKRRRAPLEDPLAELRLRLEERFGPSATAISRIVLDGIRPTRKEAQEFLEFDEAHTGAPQDLTNPGGYYRTLLVKFRLAQTNRRERERLERQTELEGRLTTPNDPSPVCALGKCNGRGEVYENGSVSVCACEAGQSLPTAVRETMALLKRGAA